MARSRHQQTAIEDGNGERAIGSLPVPLLPERENSMDIKEHIIKQLELWEKLKGLYLGAGKDWNLQPADRDVLWAIRNDAIEMGLSYDIIDRYGRLLDRH